MIRIYSQVIFSPDRNFYCQFRASVNMSRTKFVVSQSQWLHLFYCLVSIFIPGSVYATKIYALFSQWKPLVGEKITSLSGNSFCSQVTVCIQKCFQTWRIFSISRSFPVTVCSSKYRNSHQKYSMKNNVLKDFEKFTGKHLHQSVVLNKGSGSGELFLKMLSDN